MNDSDLSGMSLEEYEMYWYRLRMQIFGSKNANDWLKANRNSHLIMKQLWMEKGFKTYGEFEEWDVDHRAERNEYFRKRGVDLSIKEDYDGKI